MSPFFSLFRFLYLVLAGRVHFPRERVGEILVLENGVRMVIFRQARIDLPGKMPPNPKAEFRVRFRLAHMSLQKNKRFSLIPIPFFMGLPGFRSKLWTMDEETGFCQGIYRWDTVKDAENYARSFAVRFMIWRSEPGSVSYEIREVGKE